MRSLCHQKQRYRSKRLLFGFQARILLSFRDKARGKKAYGQLCILLISDHRKTRFSNETKRNPPARSPAQKRDHQSTRQDVLPPNLYLTLQKSRFPKCFLSC